MVNNDHNPNEVSKNTLPTGASASAREITLSAIEEYFEDGDLCYECPYYVAEPDINFYECRILIGEYPPEYSPCI